MARNAVPPMARRITSRSGSMLCLFKNIRIANRSKRRRQ
jgi:hypothetical protein